MTLPASSANVYDMNTPGGDGGIDNEAAEVGVDETDPAPKEEAASAAPAPKAAQEDSATDNPEFVKYPKE